MPDLFQKTADKKAAYRLPNPQSPIPNPIHLITSSASSVAAFHEGTSVAAM